MRKSWTQMRGAKESWIQLDTYSPEPEFATPDAPAKNVHFQDPEVTPKTPKEKAPKKTILERPLAKEFPEAEEKLVNKIFLDGKIELTYE